MDAHSLSKPVEYRNEVVVLKEGYAFGIENGWYTDVHLGLDSHFPLILLRFIFLAASFRSTLLTVY